MGGIPDEGTFEWLDEFLAENPKFLELSDRQIVDWICKSGFSKPRANSWKNSNDNPSSNFGIPPLDDLSARKTLKTLAPMFPRNYCVMEVKGNLLKAERTEWLKRFKGPEFKKVACVVMGNPPAKWSEAYHADLLKEKQSKSDEEWKKRKADRERKKQVAERQKKLQEARAKRAAEEKKKKEDKEKKAAEEAEKKEAEKKTAEDAEKKAADEEPKKEGEGGDEKKETKVEEDAEAKKEGEGGDEVKKETKDEDMKEEQKEEPKGKRRKRTPT